jgi:hypothetical protein
VQAAAGLLFPVEFPSMPVSQGVHDEAPVELENDELPHITSSPVFGVEKKPARVRLHFLIKMSQK